MIERAVGLICLLMLPLRFVLAAAGFIGGLLYAPLVGAQTSHASAPHTPAAEDAAGSTLDAELLYQLLVAELQRRSDPGAAYSIMLDAAKHTGRVELFRRAVEIALQGRAGNAALAAARAWSAALPSDDEARRTQLQLLLYLQRIDETGPLLRDWIQASPVQQRSALIAAVPAVYADVADKAQAVAAARTALAPFLHDTQTAAAAWAALGQIQRQAGNNADALLAARKAARADPRSAAAALLALELFSNGSDEAEPIVQRYLTATREGTHAVVAVPIAYARALAERGRLAEGRAVLQQAPAPTADDRRRLRMAEAQLLRDHDHAQQAYDILARMLDENPDDTDVMYEQAMVAQRLGRLAEMEQLLRQIIARKPDDPSAYNALGYTLADRGERLLEAKALIEEALRRAPDDAYIIDSMGWVEFRLGNLARARELLTDAMQRRPDPEIAAHLGEVLWALGEHDEARAAWRQGLELDRRHPTLTETLKRLGVQP